MPLDEEWEDSKAPATERPDGMTLRVLMAGVPMDQGRALRIIRQVLEALAATHDAGSIHGDVKPENVVILRGLGDIRVKLVGPARTGDPVYSAPECALGPIDARADVYSAGAVLFELLTGRPPFFADDASALRRLHAYAPMQTLKQRAPNLSFSDALESVVATALAKNRDARFQSAAAMIAALDPALQTIEAAATASLTAPRPPEHNDSLLLLAKDLMPSRSAEVANQPFVPQNVDRNVPRLPRTHKLRRAATRGVSKLRRVHKRVAAAIIAALVVGLVIAAVTCGKHAPKSSGVAERAKQLVADGKPLDAIALLQRDPHPDARAYLTLGDAHLAVHHDRQALAAYKSAIELQPALATEPSLIAGLNQIAGTTPVANAIVALELLAQRSGASGTAALVSHAATNPHARARHRAVELAERAGIEYDHVLSWSLDLEQSEDCDERRALIGKLATTSDARALDSLRRAKAQACVELDATAAIRQITESRR
jgi:serine/threonine-protein kinase